MWRRTCRPTAHLSAGERFGFSGFRVFGRFTMTIGYTGFRGLEFRAWDAGGTNCALWCKPS